MSGKNLNDENAPLVNQIVELEVIPSANKPGTCGIFPVGCSDNTRWLAECSDLAFAEELVHRSNNFYYLLEMCRANRVYLEQMKPLFRDDSPEHKEMIHILNKIDDLNEDVITEAINKRRQK